MKDRLENLRKYYKDGDYIIEIGPYFNPVFPKSKYKNVLIIDVFDRKTLIEKAKNDKNINERAIEKIEEVDFIWRNSLAKTCGDPDVNYDLIISSHNFEHQSDPIQFLIDAQELLSDTGTLSMAIPIATRCFDALRPLTSTGAWLDWYSNQQKPSYGIWFDNSRGYLSTDNGANAQLFDHENLHLSALIQPAAVLNCRFHPDQRQFNDYRDSHCSVLTSESFKALLYDLNRIGLLTKLKIFECIEGDFEFIVHLSKTREPMDFYLKDPLEVSFSSMKHYAKELSSFFKLGNS